MSDQDPTLPPSDPQEEQAGIPVGPVPTMFNVVTLDGGQTGPVVALELHTPTGVHITLWDPESANELSQSLFSAARDRSGKLLLPPSGLTVPGRG